MRKLTDLGHFPQSQSNEKVEESCKRQSPEGGVFFYRINNRMINSDEIEVGKQTLMTASSLRRIFNQSQARH